MKIKLSKSNWETIGKNAGWIKSASSEHDGLMDKILKENSKQEIVNAIKSLGEESIAGFSGVNVNDIESVLASCSEHELHEIEQAL
jgi:hypothetical protein